MGTNIFFPNLSRVKSILNNQPIRLEDTLKELKSKGIPRREVVNVYAENLRVALESTSTLIDWAMKTKFKGKVVAPSDHGGF